MSQIYKKILIVKRFGVKKIGENAIVKLNEAIKDLTPDPSPNGEGSDYRGYPYFTTCVVIRMWTYPDTSITNHQHLTTNTQHPPLANHQHPTPITQHPSEASPPAPLRMERGVITEIPLLVSGPSPLPLPRREGRDHRGYPYFAACVLMGLCTLVRSVLLCNSVRERTQEARWKLYLSQIFTDEQRPFC